MCVVNNLKVLEDSVNTRLLKSLELVLLLSVGDLAVVDDDGVASSALAGEPAKALGELDLRVGSKDLNRVSDSVFREGGEQGRGVKLTMKSSLTPLALPQPDMTKASL